MKINFCCVELEEKEKEEQKEIKGEKKEIGEDVATNILVNF